MKQKYNPNEIELNWIDKWENSNLYNPDNYKSDQTYSIVIPPPNITGSLHLGHALVNTIQDILVRWQRMKGKKTLWIPGTDHAGIATQMMVEKDLAGKGIERKKLSKQEFLDYVWQWKEKYRLNITNQLKRLGCSLDWSREKFTLDPDLSKAVLQAFITFFDQSLIYKGERLVNWCPIDQTALSDLEVDHIDTNGKLYYIKYLVDGLDPLVIATTRPETILGDVAIAVNPKDNKYQKHIGKSAFVPLIGRKIPVIADESCDPEFGTGALKVTPAHDFTDFEIGRKHSLASINIFDEKACINDIYPPLQGKDRFEARKIIIEKLQQLSLMVEIKPHKYKIAHSQRQKSIIEPRLSEQWFLNVKSFANKVLKAIENEQLKVVPQTQQSTLIHWLSNIDDWCISRQLWWGHKIPAYYCVKCDRYYTYSTNIIKNCTKCNSENIKMETDVLDTWFSSGLFPFSTLGWPDNTEDLKTYYPNSCLVTAYDILFFWVARMLMMGVGLTGKLPFPVVYAHGLIRDAKGKKMSKTSGNAIDPLLVIDQHGADALRLTLCANTNLGQDIKLAESDIINSKSFINKLFNAAKYVDYQNHLHNFELNISQIKKEDLMLTDLFSIWMLSKLSNSVIDIEENLKKYRFHEVYDLIHKIIWRDFCDVYIEASKFILKSNDKLLIRETLNVLNISIIQILKLIHPITPFVSEQINSDMYPNNGLLATSSFLNVDLIWKDKEISIVTEMLKFVSMIRTIRGSNKIHPNQKLNINLVIEDTKYKEYFQKYKPILMQFTKANSLLFVENIVVESNKIETSTSIIKIQIELPSEQINLEKIKKLTDKLITRKNHLTNTLSNKNFIKKANPQIVKKTKKELADIEQQLKNSIN